MRTWLAAAIVLALGPTVDAAELPFSAVVSLELSDQTSLTLGSAAGTVTRLSDDRLVFPAVEIELAAQSFAPAGASCVSALHAVQDGFAGGTLASTTSGYGGPLPLSGSVIADVLAGAVGSLGVPFSLGASASPATRAFTTSPVASAPPVQGFLSLSYSRWRTSPAALTATEDGAVASQWQVTGSLLSTAAGAQVISLVSPMHVYFADIDAASSPARRTIPVAGRMTITVPAPSVLVSEIVGALTLLGLAQRRRRR